MPHKRKPGALAGASGAIKDYINRNITKNEAFIKSLLTSGTVKNLRRNALLKQFCLSEAQINWLAESVFGGAANDH